MGVKDAVVKRFQGLCEERGIHINELANRSGITPSTAYSMMDGEDATLQSSPSENFVTA